MRRKALDASVIDKAPLELPIPEGEVDELTPQKQKFISELQSQNEALRAEVDALRGKNDAETQKAHLIKPYARRVFAFLCIYCVVVCLIIVFQGFNIGGFFLETPVLSILAGSTAVSAIGLVGIVVRGLFNAKK